MCRGFMLFWSLVLWSLVRGRIPGRLSGHRSRVLAVSGVLLNLIVAMGCLVAGRLTQML